MGVNRGYGRRTRAASVAVESVAAESGASNRRRYVVRESLAGLAGGFRCGGKACIKN